MAVPGGLPIIPEDIDDDDCISRGDYLELADLVDGESLSSRSDNSSCVTPTSDELFDSLALLRDLGAKISQDEKGKDANVKLSVAASIKPNEVVMRPANLGKISLSFCCFYLYTARKMGFWKTRLKMLYPIKNLLYRIIE